MRLPNGDGGVSKLSGNRRRPWRARITIGWETRGNKAVQKYKTIGYFATKSEALKALYAYNGHTPDKKIVYPTFKELFEKWYSNKESNFSDGMKYTKKNSFKFFEPIHETPINELELKSIQRLFSKADLTSNILSNHKTTLKQVLSYAITTEDIDPSFMEFVKYIDISVGKKPKRNNKGTIPLETIKDLWDTYEAKKDDVSASVLILLYTGMRTKEYLSLLKSDVDFKNEVIHIRHSKTEAGIRTIPIHSKILKVLKRQCKHKGESVFPLKLTYTQYYTKYWPLPEHTPHECRHTFISTLAVCGASQLIVQRLVGHKGYNVTENVYTHIATPEMRTTLEMLMYNYTQKVD